MAKKSTVPEIVVEEERILSMRGHRVMLDKDLAELYGVRPIALRQQVKRNLERFPSDFMFQLTNSEADLLVSQSVIPSRRSLGGFLPYVFTQEGVAMLSGVLRSSRAVQVNIAVMRAFVRMRLMLSVHKELAQKVIELEAKYSKHDRALKDVFEAIRQLMEPPSNPRNRRIGF
jgi:hypothetical protein